jgi:hypothetical protein
MRFKRSSTRVSVDWEESALTAFAGVAVAATGDSAETGVAGVWTPQEERRKAESKRNEEIFFMRSSA